jgi:hypothetical protein
MGGHLCRSWFLKHWASAFTLRAWLGMCRSQSCFREGRRVPRAGSEETAAPGRPDSPLSYTTSGINRGVWNRAVAYAPRLRSLCFSPPACCGRFSGSLAVHGRRSGFLLGLRRSSGLLLDSGWFTAPCPGIQSDRKAGRNIEHSRAVPESERLRQPQSTD